MKKIKVAQIIWPSTALPPKAYGSVQLVASRIIQNIDKKKFDLSVLTAANSKINAKIIPILDKPILEDKTITDKNLYLSVLMAEIIKRQNEFDLIHSHIGHSTLVLAQAIDKPIIMTMHGDYSNVHFKKNFLKYGKKIHYVAISKSQQKAFPLKSQLIYHGLPIADYGFSENPANYALYVGRTSPFKGLAEAIDIAIELKITLKIAAKIDNSEAAQNYFTQKIAPKLNNPFTEFLGEQSAINIKKLLQKAKVFIYPISWDEPFGLVVAEAQASGVPVVTYDRGAMSEIIKNGQTGYICKNKTEFRLNLEKIWKMNSDETANVRALSRLNIEKNFSLDKMVLEYEKIYKKVIKNCA